MSSSNKKSKKFLLTQNNPDKYGVNHQYIREMASALKSDYFCMGDEVGEKGETPHTHIFLHFKSKVVWSRIFECFGKADIQICNGSSEDNRDYILKQGRHADKHSTVIEGTFEEYGELPDDDNQGERNDLNEARERIKDGECADDIIYDNPSLNRYSKDLHAFELLCVKKNAQCYRKLENTFIFGKTRTGKTSFVAKKYGYGNFAKFNSGDAHLFDGYDFQDVVLFDEFRSQIPCSGMLQYLDGHPVELPCRYGNKPAKYTTVYVITNENPENIYCNIRYENPETFAAWVARFNHCYEFSETFIIDWGTMQNYLERNTTHFKGKYLDKSMKPIEMKPIDEEMPF